MRAVWFALSKCTAQSVGGRHNSTARPVGGDTFILRSLLAVTRAHCAVYGRLLMRIAWVVCSGNDKIEIGEIRENNEEWRDFCGGFLAEMASCSYSIQHKHTPMD